ncbi:MAG: ribonuclease P protein component [Bdellovibrionales bacterium]|nr:ribonuclease P protein component [Bdellovibrionales bacterium]
MKKRWIGWFRPLERGRKFGPLVFAPIGINEKRKKTSAVITVPGSCGNAVQRNRFRRIVRAYLAKEGVLHKPVWIRLLAQYRLPKKILISDWEKDLKRGLDSIFSS